jgi:hypothetical protein
MTENRFPFPGLKNLLNASPFSGDKKRKNGQAAEQKDTLLLLPHFDLEEADRRKMKKRRFYNR